MIRLCTHCKKADTENEELKYCQPCYKKFLHWLDNTSHSEPESVVDAFENSKGFGKRLTNREAIKLYYGRKKDG